jgi:hypothetical protein
MKQMHPRLSKMDNAPARRRGPGRPPKSPVPGYPQVVGRVSKDAEFNPATTIKQIADSWASIPADFPRFLYGIIDNVAALDPYISDYVFQTISLGNPGHKLFLNASSEAKADAAIKECNDLAARCFPWGGGMEGLINAGFHQLARTCATCTEWVPDKYFDGVQRAFKIPIKTLHFRYVDQQGNLELCQMQNDGKMVTLLPVQTSYHGMILRDSNPYPIPLILAALKPADVHGKVMRNIEAWIDKVSSLGVLLATLKSPPRGTKSQEKYDADCLDYLQKFAVALKQNLRDGLGVGFDNVTWQFQNTASGAEGAKELLQVNLQALFAALQTDPVLMGWNFGASDTFARLVFQKMLQCLNIFRLGARRDIEHGLRLNLALKGMADVQVSIQFNGDLNLDRFKESEANLMQAQALVLQLLNGIIDKEEARKALGWEEKTVQAGAFVAAYDSQANEYRKFTPSRMIWQVGEDLNLDLTRDEKVTLITNLLDKRREHGLEKRPEQQAN